MDKSDHLSSALGDLKHLLIKIPVLAVLVFGGLLLSLSTQAFEDTQENLDKTRLNKLRLLAQSIIDKDLKAFEKVLDDGKNQISKKRAKDLYDKIINEWGDVVIRKAPEPKWSRGMTKGDEKVVAYESFAGTQIGRMISLNGSKVKDCVLRLCMGFPKGDSRIGNFTAAYWVRPNNRR